MSLREVHDAYATPSISLSAINPGRTVSGGDRGEANSKALLAEGNGLEVLKNDVEVELESLKGPEEIL